MLKFFDQSNYQQVMKAIQFEGVQAEYMQKYTHHTMNHLNLPVDMQTQSHI